MKQKFTEVGVKTAEWMCASEYYINENGLISGIEKHGEDSLNYPVVAKSLHGSRGVGNTLIKSQQELEAWLPNKNLNNFFR